MVAEIIKTIRPYFQKKSGAAGQDCVIEGVGMGKRTISVGLFGPAGIMSAPPKDAVVIALPVGEGRRLMYGIACKNYKLDIVIDGGETTIFSTNYAGDTIKARIDLGGDGKIKISNATQSLHKILDDLIAHLKAASTINCVSGSPVTFSPATITNLTADATALGQLLKD